MEKSYHQKQSELLELGLKYIEQVLSKHDKIPYVSPYYKFAASGGYASTGPSFWFGFGYTTPTEHFEIALDLNSIHAGFQVVFKSMHPAEVDDLIAYEGDKDFIKLDLEHLDCVKVSLYRHIDRWVSDLPDVAKALKELVDGVIDWLKKAKGDIE